MLAAPDPLAAPSVAAHVAPIIDRLRLAVARRTRQLSVTAGLTHQLAVSEAAAQMFTLMRNAFPDRAVTCEQLGRAFTYQQPGTAPALEAELVNAGLLAARPTGMLQLSAHGQDLMSELIRLGTQAVSELWGTGTREAAALLPLVEQALDAAAATGADGFALITPPYDTPDATAEAKLSERLAGLRFHRLDAHIAAWTAAGLTAQTIRALPAGSERQAVEDDTNLRAGTAYAALKPAERLCLIAGLGALSG